MQIGQYIRIYRQAYISDLADWSIYIDDADRPKYQTMQTAYMSKHAYRPIYKTMPTHLYINKQINTIYFASNGIDRDMSYTNTS